MVTGYTLWPEQRRLTGSWLFMFADKKDCIDF